MVIVLVAGRFYERSPLKFPACGFKRLTGLPCISCRGTRSVQALAAGDVVLSLRYNPLVLVSIAIGMIWVGGYAVRKGRPPKRPISPKTATVITGVLLVGNWIFLILTNHWFP